MLYQYTQFCERFARFAAHTKATMHLDHEPARACFVDWAGDTLTVTDKITGREHKAYFFVACLPYSGYVYTAVYPDTKQRSWLDGHMNAFEYFGGVPGVLVPDNCKTAVNKTNIYLTEINQTYYEFAEHYESAVVPARSGKPRDKAAVETGVGVVERWVMAPLRNERFFSFDELAEAITPLLDAVNDRAFQQREGSRTKVFYEKERNLLKDLPQTRFEVSEWKVVKINHNYHARIDKQNYSVDYRHIGCRLDARITDSQVRIYKDGTEVACHKRLYGQMGQYSTDKAHMPPNHRYHLSSYSPERFERWAASIGPETQALIKRVLGSKPIMEQTFVPAANILGLARKDDAQLLERACEHLNEYGNIGSYTQIKNLMAALKKADSLQDVAPAQQVEDGITDGGRTRGSDYYRRGGDTHDHR